MKLNFLGIVCILIGLGIGMACLAYVVAFIIDTSNKVDEIHAKLFKDEKEDE